MHPVEKKKQKRNGYSIDVKISALDRIRSGEKQAAVGLSLVPPARATTISGWVTNEDKIRKAAGLSVKKARPPDYPELDMAMSLWTQSMLQAGLPLSDFVMVTKSCEFAAHLGIVDFKGSNGWVRGFKTRHNLTSKVHKKILLLFKNLPDIFLTISDHHWRGPQCRSYRCGGSKTSISSPVERLCR